MAIALKKTLHANNVHRDDVVIKRQKWVETQPTLDLSKLVFVDESSINCDMTRLYARSNRNERVNDYVPDIRFERTTIISSIRLDGEQAPFIRLFLN
jgi:hypothetical protein